VITTKVTTTTSPFNSSTSVSPKSGLNELEFILIISLSGGLLLALNIAIIILIIRECRKRNKISKSKYNRSNGLDNGNINGDNIKRNSLENSQKNSLELKATNNFN